MIALENVSLMRGQQNLLHDVSLVLHRGQRIGVVGRNGCGKTSLFRALAGEIPLEQGEIRLPADLNWSTMSQETPGSSRSALDHVIDAHRRFRELEHRLQRAESMDDHDQMAKLHADIEAIDGYAVKHRAEQLLSGLGFAEKDFSKPVSEFSGGWRVRLNLAAALMCPAELLMLDEPTNHLDLEATVWLEQWLQRYQGTLLLISHDRTFLDAIIDQVVSFEDGALQSYSGNYSAYEKQRAEKLALQHALHEKQLRRRQQIEEFVRRFRVKASKARQAQSRLKELARMQDIAPAHVDSPFRFRFPALGQLPSFLLQLRELSIGFDKPLVSDINLGIRCDSRIGLLGFNGSGKSTLLKVIAGQLAPLGGEIIKARKLRIGYFAQHQVDELDPGATPLELLSREDTGQHPMTDVGEQTVRDFLGGFDFRGARIDEVISNFSGGEKARLALAKVAWQRPNLLLMDEPTNHLDLEMCHALTLALQSYGGALIIVSHDRHLLANTVDEFYAIHQGVFSEFKGSLADYESWLRQTGAAQPDDAAGTGAARDKTDRRLQRQQAAARREALAPLRKQEKLLEQEIENIQAQLDAISSQLADQSFYQQDNKAELTEALRQQGELRLLLTQREEQWYDIQKQLGEG